jgi:hypothetical protein
VTAQTRTVVVVGTELAERWGDAAGAQQWKVERVVATGATLWHMRDLILASVHAAANPHVAIAVAHPAAVALARVLARGGVPVMVAPAPFGCSPGPEDDVVLLANGWRSLRGVEAAKAFVAKGRLRSLEVTIEGTPHGHRYDHETAFLNALPLLFHLTSVLRLDTAETMSGGRVRVSFNAKQTTLTIGPGDSRFAVDLLGADARAEWRVDDGVERFALQTSSGAARETLDHTAAATRELQQLAGERAADMLASVGRVERMLGDLKAAMRLTHFVPARALDEVNRALDEQLPFACLTEAEGTLRSAEREELHMPEESGEYWQFRAGLKPVVFLTLAPAEVDATRRLFEGAHIETRLRRVTINRNDVWDDRRDRGEERVELYISRDRNLALEAADRQSSSDPSAEASRLGELLGYPPCCVEAFRTLADRADNSANRYASAARVGSDELWRWELNNAGVMLIPCYPCSYACAAAAYLASAVIAEMDRASPGFAARAEAFLRRPLLYFTDQQQIMFDGVAVDESTVNYRGVAVTRHASDAFAKAAGQFLPGNQIRLERGEVVVARDGVEVTRLLLRDASLGVLLPFRRLGEV